jgi:predicted acylesterase/phospholipase RssA
MATIIGSRKLDSEDLLTGLGLVLKRMDTGSSWLVMNNPRSAFWDTPADGKTVGNRHLPLANLVRASAAAPHFFDPELIEITPGGPQGVFVDGGLTPHNNPSLLMLMAALLPAFGLNWKPGPDNLTIVSIGTGTFRPTVTPFEARRAPAIEFAIKALSSQISENQNLTLALMSWMGDCATHWPINSEIGSLAAVEWPFGSLFRFLRYDIRLEQNWLIDTLGVTASPKDIKTFRALDEPRNIPRLYQIATAAAAMQVKAADLRA